MKRLVVPIAVAVAVVVGALIGCDFTPPPTPQEQVQGFLVEASRTPQSTSMMRDYFASNTADYGSMLQPLYWDLRFFNDAQGPYTILNMTDGGEDPDFPGSVTVTGNVTNSINVDVGYPTLFVLVTESSDSLESLFSSPPPLIRRITVTVAETPEVIEKVIP